MLARGQETRDDSRRRRVSLTPLHRSGRPSVAVYNWGIVLRIAILLTMAILRGCDGAQSSSLGVCPLLPTLPRLLVLSRSSSFPNEAR
jgi:hypothetical protein